MPPIPSIRSRPHRSVLLASVALVPLVLTACVGGGGGGGGGPVVTQPAPPIGGGTTSPPAPDPASPPPSGAGDAASFETQEYLNNGTNARLNASDAYARGHLGGGVTVGLVDGLIDPDHPELAGRVLSRNDYTGTAEPDTRHAAAVAGIIAAARNGRGVHGVAPEATLRNYAITNSDGTIPGDGRTADALLQAARDGVRIVNNSWGAAGGRVSDGEEAAMRRLVDDGAVLVWAAGNEGTYTPSRESVLPTSRPHLEKGWLVVGSVEDDNTLSSFSNRCGVAKDWCLVAPGRLVGSIGVTHGTTVRATGTSFSAPAASAALAVLLDAFPSLTAQQARDILLDTATPLGDASVFGRGLIDLERATRPVGALSVAAGGSVEGAGFDLATSSLRAGGAMGDALRQGMDAAPMMVLDGYQRPYTATLPVGGPRDAYTADVGLGAFDRGGPGSFATGHRTLNFGALAVDAEVGVLDVDTAALSAMSAQPARARTDLAGHPFLGLVEDGGQMSAGMGGLGVTMLGSAEGDTVGAAVLAQPFAGHDLRLAVGTVSERGAALGATGFGALEIDGTTTTTFASLALRQPLAAPWSLVAGLHAGASQLDGQGRSLVRGFDAVSTAGAVAVERAGTFAPGGVLSFTMAQPLRVESGGFDLDRPVARTLDGAVVREVTRLDATPSGREVDLELAWSGPAFGDGTGRLAGSVLHRLQPGHVADAPSETVVMGRFSLRF